MQIQMGQQRSVSSGLELVSWQPCFPALLLQMWPEILEASCCRKIPGRFEPSQVTSPLREQGPSDCGLENFEFQTSQNQPSPIIAIERQLETTRPINTVRLLDRISSVMSPLTERNVLRSSRLNKHDGFCAVRLDKEPTKKCKIGVVKIDGRTIEARPVRLAVLQ